MPSESMPGLFQALLVSLNTGIGIGVSMVLKKVNSVDKRMGEISERVARMEGKWQGLDARCQYEAERIAQLQKRVNDLQAG